MSIRKDIKEAMKNNNIETIKDLSIITGISQAYLYKIVEKENINISEDTAKKLNKVLNLKLTGEERRVNDDSIGYKIFKLRIERKMKAESLALLADLSISTIWALEQNRNKPSSLTVKKLAKAFNIKESELQKILFII